MAMNTDINSGIHSLRDNMVCTISFALKHSRLQILSNLTLDHYLGEIQVLIDSYDKHGKDKEDVKE
jgi:hypothetical protein